MEKIDKINFRGRRLKNTQNLRQNEAVARTQEESEVKYSPINQFIKGSTAGLVMNSYLNDNLEDKQCYVSLDSFSTKRNLNLGRKLRFTF